MLEVGIIGVGSMGQNHARILAQMGNLAGICDVSIDQAKRLANKFGVNSYAEPEKMLEDVDAVIIATPTSTHFDIATKAIEARKNVLVEKPFTGLSETAIKLVKEARSKNVLLASGFVERYNPAVEAAKKATSAGEFGQIVTLSSRRVSSFPGRIRDVGVIMDLAVHDIDIMRGIAGSEVQSVFAMGGSHANKAFEDYANILLQFKDGKVGFVEVNWLTPMKVRKMFLTCSEKYVQIDYIDQSVEISSSKIEGLDASNMFRLPIEYDVKRVSVRKDEPLKRELESFISACETGAMNVATGQDAVENIKVCEAALISLKRKEAVPIHTSKID